MGYPRDGGISSAATAAGFVTVGEGRRFNEVSAAIMRVQLAKLPSIAKAMSATKRAIQAGLKPTVPCEMRAEVDPAGDLGSTLDDRVRGSRRRRRFLAAGRALFGEAWFVGAAQGLGPAHLLQLHATWCRPVPVLPNGFPWNLPENKGEHRYEKGTCPKTDALLARGRSASASPRTSTTSTARR